MFSTLQSSSIHRLCISVLHCNGSGTEQPENVDFYEAVAIVDPGDTTFGGDLKISGHPSIAFRLFQ